MTALVDPVAAEWIRSVVLPGLDLYPCACLWGQCGHCDAGRHGHCTAKTNPVRGSSETWICNRRGQVLDPRLPVWLADRACRWVCPCECPPVVVPDAQLDLFGGAA